MDGAPASKPLPAVPPQGEAQNATSLMCSVGKIPFCGTFPRLPTLCLLKSVFTACRLPGPRVAPSQRTIRLLSKGVWGPWDSPARVPGPTPQRIYLGFSSSSKKNMYPDGSRQKLCGQEGPEKGPTYGHCKGKGEKLKKEKKVRYGE